MSAALSLFLAAGIAASAPQPARPLHASPCRAAEAVAQMGGISSAEPAQRRGAARSADPESEPKLVRMGFDPEPLTRIHFLCKDDQILNPPDSGKVITIFVDGSPVSFRPSPKPQSIPVPDWGARLLDLAGQVGLLFGGYDNGHHRFEEPILHGYGESQTVVRTTDGSCSLSPGVTTEGDNFVLRSEKTVHLGFSCAPGTRLPHLALKSRTGVMPIILQNWMIDLSLERDCSDRCELQITNGDGSRAATVRISPVSTMVLDKDDARLLDDRSPVGGAMVAMHLLRQPGWAIGGASMLWSRACVLPVAAGVAASTYRVSSSEFCASNPSYARGVSRRIG